MYKTPHPAVPLYRHGLSVREIMSQLGAMTAGTDDWGSHGSVVDHALYIEPQDPTRRRCGCGCRTKITYRCMANGVCLSEGCHLSALRWLKENVRP